MELFVVSFVAGILTVAAPCILPLLPIIIGGSLAKGDREKNDYTRPILISLSLGVSVVVSTLLLKVSTSLLGVPEQVWALISGLLIIALGISLVQPLFWAKLSSKLHLETNSLKFLSKSDKHNGRTGDILTGLALGPVFNSCSPTYLLIVAAVLPISFWQGFAYLIAYAAGLASTLLMISFFGQSIIKRLNWLNNLATLQKVIGVLFVIVGVGIIFRLDKNFQSYVLERGWYDPIARLEDSLK